MISIFHYHLRYSLTHESYNLCYPYNFQANLHVAYGSGLYSLGCIDIDQQLITDSLDLIESCTSLHPWEHFPYASPVTMLMSSMESMSKRIWS